MKNLNTNTENLGEVITLNEVEYFQPNDLDALKEIMKLHPDARIYDMSQKFGHHNWNRHQMNKVSDICFCSISDDEHILELNEGDDVNLIVNENYGYESFGYCSWDDADEEFGQESVVEWKSELVELKAELEIGINIIEGRRFAGNHNLVNFNYDSTSYRTVVAF